MEEVRELLRKKGNWHHIEGVRSSHTRPRDARSGPGPRLVLNHHIGDATYVLEKTVLITNRRSHPSGRLKLTVKKLCK